MLKTTDAEHQKQYSTGRAITRLMRNTSKIFQSTDDVSFVQEHSRLGIWIGVKPGRHIELFEDLAARYFKGFEIHRHSANNREWARFGYDYDGRVPTEVTKTSEHAKEATA